jgi:hypothetical protein
MALTKDQQKEESLERQIQNERIHALVVKIISWKTGIIDGAIITHDNKITTEEWNRYSKHLLAISKTDPVEKTKQKLADIHKAIKSNGGFEEK